MSETVSRLDGWAKVARPIATFLSGIPRIDVLGVGVSAVNVDLAVAEIGRWIAMKNRQYICVTGMHGIVESQDSEELLAIHHRAGLVVPDGRPLVWLLWWNGHRRADQVCGRDLMTSTLAHGAPLGWRHFLYGTRPETLDLLEARLKAHFPGILIAGKISPPFRACTPEEDQAIVDQINHSEADIVWVGLSTPKQEFWMASHRARLGAPALVGVGAAFDFHAGTMHHAPRFIQVIGFEWLYRLAAEPRRLWRRYATGIPRFLGGVAIQLLGLRRYPTGTSIQK